MAKAPIKLEGYIGNTKVCNDLILGGNSHDRAFSDMYAKMIYVPIEGLKDPSADAKHPEETYEELKCPITDVALEEDVLKKANLQRTRSI